MHRRKLADWLPQSHRMTAIPVKGQRALSWKMKTSTGTCTYIGRINERTAITLPSVTCIRAAEGGVEDHAVVEEVRINVAATLEVCDRHTESVRVWSGVVGLDYARRHLVPAEEPYLNGGRCPLHSVHTTGRLIERSPDVVGLRRGDAAASIATSSLLHISIGLQR